MQSLACPPGNLPRLEGYYYPPVVGPVSPRDKVMACIYIRHNVLFSNEPNITGPPNGYTCGVRVRVQGQLDFMIVNCYTPQPCTSFDWLTELGGKGRCLVTGDFNVRDSSWERDYESSSSTLTAQIDNSDFIVLNDGSFTRIPDRSDQRPSAIDLTLVTPDTASGAEWEVGADSLSSDHLPITVSFVFSAEKETPATTSKYNYDLANWDLFRNLLGTAEINVGDADLDEVNRRIVSSILEAAREAIPVTGGGLSRSNSNPWWNKECEEAVRLKRVMYRHYSKDQNAETHERMKAANRDCNKIIAQAKKDHWIAFADSISAGKADLGSVWKKIRRMKQQCVVPDSDLQHGSTKYTTAQSKADALAKAFAEASDTDSLPADRQQFRREMEATFTHPVPDDSLAVNTPLTCTELRRALASIKKVKVSTGVDTVSYRMLKEAPESFLKILLDFFQRCWDGGTIPAGWKHAIVVPIHKHGKPRKELGSYRPISLTSHLGKVYERVIKNRLEYYCESKKVFPVCQAGFRRGRGVTDHLVKLGEHVGRAIGRRKVLLTCFFDISRAYDQVWHAKLLQKLNKIGISGNMYNYIRSFLSDRSMQVRWKGATSTTKGVSMGVPQGSVIAPLLFNIMVHDVDTAVKGKVVLTMYADDLAIWTDTHIRRLHTNSSWVKQSMKLFQEAVDGVVHFMQVNGFALSSQKTVFLPFHTNTSQNTEVHIRVNGQSIFASKEVKYLGVHFTRWGRTNQQVAHNARNASRALNVIKVLSAQPWANTPKILVNVVRALVRSRLSYGLEAMPHLSKTGLARLTAIEVRGLRLALGLPQSVPQCLVYREAGLLPFRRHIQLVCSKYVFRCQTVDNSTVDEITATFRKPSRLQSYSSICDLVCDLVRSAGLDGVEVATRPMHPYPPWLLERAHVEVDMEGLMKDQNPLVLAVTARLCLEEKYQHHLKIFTDGSVMEDGAAGAAFVIPEFNNLTHSYSLPAVSVFTAELLAISMALQHISAIPVTPFAIVICSDSKAALTAIKSDSQNAREDLVREIATTTHQLITRGTEVRFQWVPAHVCLSGNEKADRAAKRGAKGVDSSTVTMKIGLADVYAELTKQAWKQWEKEFHPMATAKEWDDTSPPCRAGVFFPGIPTYLARIMHRLHVGVWRCMCVPTKCECGMSVSFHHVMFSCTSCSDHFQPLTGKLRSVGLPLCTKSLAVCDQREGWSLLRAAARLVYTCPLAAYL